MQRRTSNAKPDCEEKRDLDKRSLINQNKENELDPDTRLEKRMFANDTALAKRSFADTKPGRKVWSRLTHASSKAPESDNAKLKKLPAEKMLDNAMLRDVNSKTSA